MGTPVEELAAFNITESMKIAEADFKKWGREEPETALEMGGEKHLTVRGWWRIILHEEKRIKALKRQVNRLIQGSTIEGDDVPYPDDECWPEDGLTGSDSIRAGEDQRAVDSLNGTIRALSMGYDVGKAQSQALEEELKKQEEAVLRGLEAQRVLLCDHPLHAFVRAQKVEVKHIIVRRISEVLRQQERYLYVLPKQDRWDVHFPGVMRTPGKVVSVTNSGVYLDYPDVNYCFLDYDNIEQLVVLDEQTRQFAPAEVDATVIKFKEPIPKPGAPVIPIGKTGFVMQEIIPGSEDPGEE